MRLGEILGLQWDHVFMDDALVASGEACLKIDRELRRCSNDSIKVLEQVQYGAVQMSAGYAQEMHNNAGSEGT